MRRPLPIALGCAAVAALIYVLALHTTAGGHVDAAVLDAFARLRSPWLDGARARPGALPRPGAVRAARRRAGGDRARPRAAAPRARGRRRARRRGAHLAAAQAAAREPAAVGDPGGVGDRLRLMAERSHHRGGGARPLRRADRAAPPGVRRWPLAFALAVPCALVLLGSHWPSDVLGGVCVAGLWFALGVAVLPRVPVPRVSPRAVVALVLAGAAAVLSPPPPGRGPRPSSCRSTRRSPPRRACSRSRVRCSWPARASPAASAAAARRRSASRRGRSSRRRRRSPA